MQFLRVAAHAGGADNQAHLVGQLELVEHFLEIGAIVTLDPARDAASAWTIRHQHQIAAGEGDERGQGSALVAAFFLFHLDQQFLTFPEQIADAGAVGVHALREVVARDFLHRQKAVAVGAVIDEAGFERLLDAGNAAFVDIGLFLFLGGNLDIEIVQGLAIHNGHTQLFTLSCVDQHTLHFFISLSARPRVVPRSCASCQRRGIAKTVGAVRVRGNACSCRRDHSRQGC